jgi:hypothetical protein
MKPLPAKVRKLGEVVRALNQLIECVEERTILDSPDIKTIRNTRGVALLSTGNKGGGGDSDNVWQ